MARLGIADGNSGFSAMDQPQNITEELKYWPDDRLDQALETAIYSENSPTPTEGPLAPGYLVLAEKSRRQDLRARGTGGGEGVPQTTVAEEMLAGGQGMGPGMDPQMGPGMMPPGMPPQGMPPQGMPQEDPMQFLTSLQGGPQGMPPGMPPGMPQGMPPQGMPMGPMMANTGGLIQRYADGGLTSLTDEQKELNRKIFELDKILANPLRPDQREQLENQRLQIENEKNQIGSDRLSLHSSAEALVAERGMESLSPEELATVERDFVSPTESGFRGLFNIRDYYQPDLGAQAGSRLAAQQQADDFLRRQSAPSPSPAAIAAANPGPMSGGPMGDKESFLAGLTDPADTRQGPVVPPGVDPTVDPVADGVGGLASAQGLGMGTRVPQLNPEYMDQMNIMRTRMDELGSAGAAESAALREQIANMSMMSAPKEQNYMDPARLAFAAGLMGGRTVGEGISAGLKASSPYMQQGINQRNRDREIGNRQQLENLRMQASISETQRGQEINTLNRQLGSLERSADRDLGMQEFGIAQENLFKRQINSNDQQALDRAFQKNQQAQRIKASLEEVGVRMTASRVQFMTAELIDAQQSVMESPVYQQLLMVSQSPGSSEEDREKARQQAANMMNDASVGVQTSFTQMFGDRSGNQSTHFASRS
jgi:hypothetical protein